MWNEVTGIQSAKSRKQERLQIKQVAFQQINYKGEKRLQGEKRDLKRLEAYLAIAMYETDLTTDRKTIKIIENN